MNGSKNFAGKETFQRMNYLYQASEKLMNKSAKDNVKTHKDCLEYISNYYSSLMISIGKKSQLRMDTSIKRTMCKGCQRYLIPGKTVRIRVRKKPTKHTRWTCLHCGSFRTYNMNKNYHLWTENPDAQIDHVKKVETHQETKKSNGETNK